MSKPSDDRYARVVSLSILGDKEAALRKTYRAIMRKLVRQKGLRRVYLLAEEGNPGKMLSVTFWNNLKDAEAYVKSGAYQQNVAAAKDMLTTEPSVAVYRVLERGVGVSLAKVARKPKRRKKR